MIVYGDARRVETTASVLGRLRDDGRALTEARDEPSRRDAATRLLIDAGEFAQGVLDAAFAERGCDDWGECEQACGALTREAARRFLHAGPPDTRCFADHLNALGRLTLPDTLTITVPEGYAFYALDPELYARAAAPRSREPQASVVIGLRSIGTSLAAVVAVALRADVSPVTLRPVGHPFQREVRIGPRLERLLLDRPPGTRYAIVDEGPGLSGSSFGAVADWLEDHGIARECIHFFPGHGGDLGPQASDRHRARWHRAARHKVDFEELGPHVDWFEPGQVAGELEDRSGGRWRAKLYPCERDWPPANPAQERRKYLYRADGQTWLAKFAGLGRYGNAKLTLARQLADAGFLPPVRGLRRGFLIREWVDARPLASTHFDRAALIERIAEYLAFRARAFPAGDETPGATAEELFHMARFNIAERFGEEVAACLDTWRDRLDDVARRTPRVITDNRMHAWEWLLHPDGRILKVDALDHHAAHDCIGAQDIAWDVAGAAVEWELSAGERDRLERGIAARTGCRVDPRVMGFYEFCYPAFQLGYFTMAADSCATFQPEEAARLRDTAERYAVRLRELLAGIGA